MTKRHLGKHELEPEKRANSAAVVLDPGGRSPVLLICDHASNWIPDEYAELGVAPQMLNAHVAWDEGAETVTRTWSRILEAKAVMGVVSRLVIDLNRQPERPDVIPAVSHGVNVPGNEGLTREERESRFERFYYPYHDMVDQLVTDDVEVLMTVHTFSQDVDPVARDFEIGLLYDRYGAKMVELAKQFESAGCRTRLNEPYSGMSEVESTARRHGRQHGRVYFELEINSRLVSEPGKAVEWAERLAPVLRSLTGNL